MSTDNIISNIKPILKKHNIQKSDIFGSVAYGKATTKSDIDLLVEMPKKSTLMGFVRLKRDLEDKLGKKVDLVEYSSISLRLAPHVFSKTIGVL